MIYVRKVTQPIQLKPILQPLNRFKTICNDHTIIRGYAIYIDKNKCCGTALGKPLHITAGNIESVRGINGPMITERAFKSCRTLTPKTK